MDEKVKYASEEFKSREEEFVKAFWEKSKAVISERLDKNDIDMVRMWEAIQRMDRLLREVESTAADAITIARLLAKQRGVK